MLSLPFAAFLIDPAVVPSDGAADGVLRTIVLQELIVGDKCEIDDVEGLIAQTEERLLMLPLEALGYRYRSRADIGYSSRWNPVPDGAPAGSGEGLSNDQILAHLQKLRVKKLLVLDLTCHDETGTRAILTGRMIDLDSEVRRLECPEEDQRELDGKLMCLSNSQESSTRLARTRLTNWSEFPSAVSSNLSQLFQVPFVTPSDTNITTLIAATIRVPMTIQWNRADARWRRMTLESTVLDLPEDRAKQACDAPGEYWETLHELAEEDAADHKLALNKRDVIAVDVPKSEKRSRIEFRVKSYRSVYLIRARLVSEKGQSPLASLPAYVCVTATAPQWMIGYEFTAGKPWDLGWATRIGAPYTNPQIQFGLRLLLLRQFLGSRTRYFSLLRVGLGLGFTYVSGTYPCIDPRAANCGRPESGPQDVLFRASTSLSGDIALVMQGDIVRFKRLSLTLVANFGMGLERLRSTPSLATNGTHALFRTGGGLLLTGLGLLPKRHAGMFWGGVLFDMRARLGDDFELRGALVYKPGVSDSIAVLFSVGGLFSLRSM